VLVSDFDYVLPQELIAQEPLPARDASRMLHLRRCDQGTAGAQPTSSAPLIADRHFRDFPALLRDDDLVVFNNTRVFPARLHGARQPQLVKSDVTQTGRIEVLLVRQASVDPNEWDCLVRPGRKVRVGERLVFASSNSGARRDASCDPSPALEAVVVAKGAFGERRIRFDPVPDFTDLLDRLGHVPLPPYMHREDLPGDRERYQTVYARERGSVAAPTAGLHFTPAILARLRERGIETAEVTLHVGLGTFSPIRSERVEDHRIHPESFEISLAAADSINRARAQKRRVVAIGTTTVRTLEYSAQKSPDGILCAGKGEADIFIYPGYDFKVVGAMLTNFHLPQSTLLMLTCAFAGTSNVLAAYEHAVKERYRFYSYGDCLFLE
jgi:S-adenosylmethionine:tRNA ribosyltransferase-isomerase